MTAERRPAVAFTTLGCRLNQADSEELARRFANQGYAVVPEQELADVVVVNSCTVTNLADRQSRQAARHAARLNPAALVVLTGCYPSVAPEEAAEVEGVGLVVSNRGKATLVEQVDAALTARGWAPPAAVAPLSAPLPGWFGRTRAQLKVEEGCNNRCTFCIVPTARGAQRSRSIAECVEIVRGFVAAGYREVVLTGTHLGGYGRDLATTDAAGVRRAPGLADLVAALLAETAVERLRLSSVEPQDFPRARLDLWSDRRLCRHFHLPVQSGSDAVLRRMRRGYTRTRYLGLVAAIRAAVPGAALTTDVIVGFPGESEEDFAATCSLVETAGFAKVHAFPFSPRAGTPAAKMPDPVDARTARRRMAQLTNLTEDLARRWRERHVGAAVDVLFEEEVAPGLWQGLTDDYLRVQASSPEPLFNQLVPVRITEATPFGARGALAARPTNQPAALGVEPGQGANRRAAQAGRARRPSHLLPVLPADALRG